MATFITNRECWRIRSQELTQITMMEELVPNTVEASNEKHLPAVTVEDGAINVNVGSVNHPMADEHYTLFGFSLCFVSFFVSSFLASFFSFSCSFSTSFKSS